ncbi:MAG: hypothetical protein HYW05_00315 [Candidatus Diapherotrites archaeon]|nr:hypothetical protein [Candidatus Diapherotrites archaeon]
MKGKIRQRTPAAKLSEALEKTISPELGQRWEGYDLLSSWKGAARNRKAVAMLKGAVFDFNKSVRATAVDKMADLFGWKETVEFINAKLRTAGKVPAAFFVSTLGLIRRFYESKREGSHWYPKEWRAMSRQAIIRAHNLGLERARGRNGKPISVNGMPVFLSELRKDFMGEHKSGLLLVNKDPKTTPVEDREAVSWHEFGEIFNDKTGNAFVIYYLKKTGRLQDFLKRYPGITEEFKKIEMNWTK